GRATPLFGKGVPLQAPMDAPTGLAVRVVLLHLPDTPMGRSVSASAGAEKCLAKGYIVPPNESAIPAGATPCASTTPTAWRRLRRMLSARGSGSEIIGDRFT